MGLGEAPRPVRPGEQLRAGWLNDLRAFILRSQVARVDGGLLMKQTDAGIVIALSGNPDVVKWARITSDHPPDPAPVTLAYDVKLQGDERTLTGLVPANRPARAGDGRKIIPVPKGSLCAVLYPLGKKSVADKYLIVFGEVTATVTCGDSGDGTAAAPATTPHDRLAALVVHLMQRVDVLEAALARTS